MAMAMVEKEWQSAVLGHGGEGWADDGDGVDLAVA
jgi:hypothetical protein